MKKMFFLLSSLFVATFLEVSCSTTSCSKQKKNEFGTDKTFLLKNTDAVVLSSKSGESQVIVVPQYQGRVMTSTAKGNKGLSFGWINRELIESKKLVPHMNAFGGEDRFWMGPEGGQYGLYFKPESEFSFANWQVPPPFDTETYPITSKTDNSVTFEKKFEVKNYSDNIFNVSIKRTINLLNKSEAEKELGVDIPNSVSMVGYSSINEVTNIGTTSWKESTGLISIWILGNYAPSSGAKILLPINNSPDLDSEEQYNVYTSFGDIPKNRLKVKDNVVIFSADGKKRGKIGLSPERAKDILGSYDSTTNVLTIVKYNKPENNNLYVNSSWELQKHPYTGDVVNAYNDGPLGNGEKQLGPFYELETSSPALLLAPGEHFIHSRYTFHFQGSKKDINAISEKLLGISLMDISN